MDDQQRKAMIKESFNTVSGGYDNRALRFFPESAKHMAALLGLNGSEHVLDVACGTGHASLAVAGMLPKGRVTAVDFSLGMLDQAREKAAAHGVRNIDFMERDMQDLGFAGSPFDVAVCAFGIFFVEDMESQLAHITSAVRPGGRVMVTSFRESYFQPMRDLLFHRIAAFGVRNPPQAWKRVATEAGCRQLFETAGFTDIRVDSKNVGYHLASAGEWWDIVWNAGFRRLLLQLTPGDQERFKQEHLEEVEALKTKDGIWLDVEVLYTSGMKQGKP